MLNEYVSVVHNGNAYKVCKDAKGNVFVVDDDISLPLKTFYQISVGYFCCHMKQGPVYLHHLVMDHAFDGLYVDHINREKGDNRKSNLRLITQSEQNKNQHKRTRNTQLPDNCNITQGDIPTFIWYQKAHGAMATGGLLRQIRVENYIGKEYIN